MTDPTPPDVPVEEPKVVAPADNVEKPGPEPKAAKAFSSGRHWSDTAAILLSSLVIPLPIFVGRLVEVILDTANPNNIDVASPLAYLGQILGISFGVLGALMVVIVIVYLIVYRRHRTLDALKLPLLILALQIVLGVLILLFNAIVNNAG
jgi:hypothetical protein